MSACAAGPGTGFATLAQSRVTASLEPGAARDLGDHTLLTDLAFRVHLDQAELDFAEIELEELSGGAGPGGSFDPASPPPGYTLCHGGHCHHEDGRLVPYVEVEAELSGTAASFSTVATVVVERTLDLLAPERFGHREVTPSPELPQAEIRRAVLHVVSLRLDGTVAGGAEDGLAEMPLVVDLALDERLSAPLEHTVDRRSPPELALQAHVPIDGTLFDGIDFTAWRTADLVSLDDPHSGEGLTLVEHLAGQVPDIQLRPLEKP